MVWKTSTLAVWHKRLGHPSSHILHHLVKNNAFPVIGKSIMTNCVDCSLNKSCHLKFSHSVTISPEPLYLIHSNLWEPTHELCYGHYCYYLIFIDDDSRYSWLFPLVNKSETFDYFCKFKSVVEKQFGTDINLFNLMVGRSM